MFEDLRQAFREAVRNFREELNRDDVPERVDQLLSGMVREVTDAKARLSALESQIEEGTKRLEVEVKEVETCLRREKMARDIGDEETAAVAAEFGRKHQERAEILERKVAAIREEAALLEREIEQMMGQVKEAKLRRDGLTAEAGRTDARGSLGESGDLFDEFDRMSSRIDGDDAEREAWEELSSMGRRSDSDLTIDFDEPVEREVVDLDARLAELKRRMGEDPGN